MTYSGPPPRLASDARRFDSSPASFSWVVTQPALELLNRLRIAFVYEHDVALANRFRAGVAMALSDSAIVTVGHPHADGHVERAAVSVAERGGTLRVSCHVPNAAADIDAALDALTG